MDRYRSAAQGLGNPDLQHQYLALSLFFPVHLSTWWGTRTWTWALFARERPISRGCDEGTPKPQRLGKGEREAVVQSLRAWGVGSLPGCVTLGEFFI